VKLLPKQRAFVRAKAFEVMLSGAFGAGKSRGVCYKLLTHAMIPGNFVGLCRKTFADLKKTTLRTLLEPESDLPPVLPRGTYTHNKGDHLIRLNSGGTILYFGFDQELSLGSLNFGAIGIDEGIELTPGEYTMLLGRARNTADPWNQVWTATNPGPPTHFLHERFYNPNGADTVLIETNALENPYLPERYIRLLKSFSGTDYERYVLGKWTAYEGLVYRMDRAVHVVHKEGPWKRILLGVDEGYSNPAVILCIGFDGDMRGHVFREFYKAGIGPKEFVAILKEIAQDVGYERVYIDPSAAGLIADCRTAGLRVAAGDNAVKSGIRTVQDAFAVAGDGLPRLTIEPSCRHTISEHEGYCWKKGKDEPVKERDHTCDALRYPLHTVLGRPKPTITRY